MRAVRMITLRILLRANADRLTLCALGAAIGLVVGVTGVYCALIFCPDTTP